MTTLHLKQNSMFNLKLLFDEGLIRNSPNYNFSIFIY